MAGGHTHTHTWAPRLAHMGPKAHTHGPQGWHTWAPRLKHMGPKARRHGPQGSHTRAPRLTHMGPKTHTLNVNIPDQAKTKMTKQF